MTPNVDDPAKVDAYLMELVKRKPGLDAIAERLRQRSLLFYAMTHGEGKPHYFGARQKDKR